MTSEARLPGLRWLAVALTFGRSDNGNVWPSSLGEDLARGLEGAPVGWYNDESRPRRLKHVPEGPHKMDVHREYEVALVESAWVEPQGVFAVVHFYLPLSPRAARAREELLAYEARGELLQAPGLSVMGDVVFTKSGPLKNITRIGKVEALDFVHRASAEGCVIRSLAFEEKVGPAPLPLLEAGEEARIPEASLTLPLASEGLTYERVTNSSGQIVGPVVRESRTSDGLAYERIRSVDGLAITQP